MAGFARITRPTRTARNSRRCGSIAITGAVHVERYLIAFDVGRAINPALVRAQIVGGFAQGLGGALYEEFQYSPEGEPLSVTFADYLIPTLREVPAIDVLILEDAPTFRNPLGIKGAGEGGIAAVAAAIAAAVDDALQRPGANHADAHQAAADRAASPGRPAAALRSERQRRAMSMRGPKSKKRYSYKVWHTGD